MNCKGQGPVHGWTRPWLDPRTVLQEWDEGLWMGRGDGQTYFPVTSALSENRTDVSQEGDLGREATGEGREGKV